MAIAPRPQPPAARSAQPRPSSPGRPATGEPQPGGDKALERELDRLGHDIQRFRVDTQRFFAGDLKLPPDELRERIQIDLKRLRSSNLRGTAIQFRLGTLEAQLVAQVDLYGRRVRAQEKSAAARHAPEETAPDPANGVVVGTRPEATAVQALYQGLYMKGDKAPAMDLDRFRGYLQQQADAIRAKTGCTDIVFRVAEEDGKLKLKARPLKAGS